MGKYRKESGESMAKIDLSIITVTYKSEAEIASMIESVLQTCKKHTFEVIISDNSPDENTGNIVRDLQKNHSCIHYFKNSENIGFSKANNKAIKKALGKYVLFLNPDVVVSEKTIDGICDFLEKHEDVGAATCAVYLPDGKLDDSCHRGFPTPWNSFTYFSGLARIFSNSKLFSGYNLTYLDVTKAHAIDSLAGSFMMMSKNLGNSLGWWDEDFFFYGEDLDFCYRIKEAGYGVYFIPEYTAVHFKGMSSGIKDVSRKKSQATLETKKWATNQRFKAMEIFYNKHYKNKYPKFIADLVYFGISLKKKKALNSI